MPQVRLFNGKPLMVGNKVAMSDACCCGALPCPCPPCGAGVAATITFHNVTFCGCIGGGGYWRDVGTGCEKFAPTSCWALGDNGDVCGDGGHWYVDNSLGGGGGGRQFKSFSCDGTPGTVYNNIPIVVEHASNGTWYVLVYLVAGTQNAFFMGQGSDPSHVSMVGNCVPGALYDTPLIDCWFGTPQPEIIWTTGSWASIHVCPP